jgi:chorismate synthase
MNAFGNLFRVQIFGESHGPVVGICIDGCPAGIALNQEDFTADIARRKPGAKGTTPRQEEDMPIFQSGVFNDHTTGAPLTIVFTNNNTRSVDYDKHKDQPRPGHVDFVANKKYGGFEDYRGGGHFSGRLTLCLVAAGVVAKKTIQHLYTKSPIEIHANISEVAGETDIDKGIQKAIDANDTVGGIVTCTTTGLPIGLGEPFFNSMESLISHAVFSIPAIKGIEFGAGFEAATMYGSKHNDALLLPDGTTQTNFSGGIVGGLSNGNPMVFRVAVKPPSSTPQIQETLNLASGKIEKLSVEGRHDLCIALRVTVVIESVTAMVLADALMHSSLRRL